MTVRVPARRQVQGAWEAPLVLLVAYLVAMALLAVSAYVDFRNARELEASTSKVSATLEAMEKIRQTGNTFFIAETSERGYVLTGDATYLEPYRDMRQRIALRLTEIERLASDSTAQRNAVARLRALATRQFAEMDVVLEAFRTTGQAGAIAAARLNDGIESMAAVREVIGALLDEEARSLVTRRTAAETAYTSGLVKAALSTVVVGLALTGFYLLMQRFLRQRDAALAVVEANNVELEQKVLDRTEDLSHLSRHLLNAREDEKKGIARDLHDDFGSYLTAINMDVSRARDKIAATHPEQAAKLERTLGLLGSAIELKRQLISDLRPSMLDNLGLGAALEQYIDEWSRRTGIAATFDHDGVLDSSEEGCPIAVFRVFQEALANVAKHSEATRVAAQAYRVGDRIEFEIADDGIGLPDAVRTKPGAHGLLGIRERVLAYRGEVEMSRAPSGGTVVRGWIPCEPPIARDEAAPLVFARI